jgi:hypothetical protein
MCWLLLLKAYVLLAPQSRAESFFVDHAAILRSKLISYLMVSVMCSGMIQMVGMSLSALIMSSIIATKCNEMNDARH